MDVAQVQVGADGIGGEAVGDGALPGAKPEAALAVTQIKVDAPIPSLAHVVMDPPVVVEHRKMTGEDVGVNVPRAKLLEDEIGIGSFGGTGIEIHHRGHAAQGAGLDGLLHRGPGRVVVVEGLAAPVVGGLDADDHVTVGGGGGCRVRGVEVGDHLLRTAHAGGRDVDVGQDAADGRVDQAGAEVLKFQVAGGAGVDAGGDTLFQEMGIGVEGIEPVARFSSAGPVGVEVYVDDAGSDQLVANIDQVAGFLVSNGLGDCRDAPVLYGDVSDAVDLVGWIDNATALEK